MTGADVTVEETKENVPFIPPSLPDLANCNIHSTHTYLTEVPAVIKANPAEPCILGVDEAGRGPVLGPMVYALSYCPISFKEDLAKVGFADSKVLNHETRSALLERICNDEELKSNIGWASTIMTARDISSGMLRPENQFQYNLNQQAHDTTMALIQKVLDLRVKIAEIYVDTVGPPEKYQAKLSMRFPGIKITVAKKADSLYPIVSAASICAKVTRDASLITIDESNGTWGSGYPSDGKTSTWLKSNVDPVFGWSKVVRFSWQTTKDVLEKHNGVEVEWADDFAKKKNAANFFASSTTSVSQLVTSKVYGLNVDKLT
ncbi:ribonuclease H2 subunit A [Trichomonascus vanleenenianus]|uniref:ribonuclease H2 catalytic subunit RNH201 n=1 Tax=Trichomonascus vanleenenianus TaxID=2268995 RepID=UPI003EC9AF83